MSCGLAFLLMWSSAARAQTPVLWSEEDYAAEQAEITLNGARGDLRQHVRTLVGEPPSASNKADWLSMTQTVHDYLDSADDRVWTLDFWGELVNRAEPPRNAKVRNNDQDFDGQPDWLDLCRLDAHDTAHGCAMDAAPVLILRETDIDGDGLLDSNDACPREAETVNGYQDTDGCPDERPQPEPAEEPVAAKVSPAPPPTPQPQPQPVAATLPDVSRRYVSGTRSPADSAVVIGLEKYVMEGVGDVPYAHRDAEAVYNFLLYTRGLSADRIQYLRKGSREHILAAVGRAGEQTDADGTVWIYFAGHGAASLDKGERLLMGDDFRPDPVSFAARGVSVPEIEDLAAKGGAQTMMMVDACFTGTGRDGASLIAGARFAVPSYAVVRAEQSSQWNAASENEISGPLEAAQHGAFTYFAVGAMRGWADGELDQQRDGKVTAEEATVYVQRAMRTHQLYDQTPSWVGASDVVLAEGVSEVGPDF